MRKPGFIALALLCASSAQAQFTIGAGSAFDLGSGSLDQGCLPLAVDGALRVQSGQWLGIADLAIGAAGSLDGGSGTLSLSGDFTRAGGFDAGSGQFRSVDGCGSVGTAFSAGNAFHRLTVSTTSGRTLSLPAGSTQTVRQALTLSGAAGNRLLIRSTAAGSEAFTHLLAGATQAIAFVDVADNHATGQAIAPGPAANYQSVQGDNVQRWFIGTPPGPGVDGIRPIPALGTLGLWLTALLAAGAGALRLRRHG